MPETVTLSVEAAQPLIDLAGHSLTRDGPENPVWLDADPARLADRVSNSVRDTGMGTPAVMLGTAIPRFTQIKLKLDRAQDGLGIGGSQVKTLIDLHAGPVLAPSTGIDRGSKFMVSLPSADAPAAGAPAPALASALASASASASDAVTPLARHRILVVDDNVDAAETLAMLLHLSGHDACAAFGGQEALDVARTFRPALVLLDIGLPGMNGYEVAQRLRADPLTSSTILIAVTGWGTDEDIRKTTMAGFHAHLTKPVDPERIDTILADFLPGRRPDDNRSNVMGK